jgi:hypothetical protein
MKGDQALDLLSKMRGQRERGDWSVAFPSFMLETAAPSVLSQSTILSYRKCSQSNIGMRHANVVSVTFQVGRTYIWREASGQSPFFMNLVFTATLNKFVLKFFITET